MATRSVFLLDFDNIFFGLWQVDRELAMRFGYEPMEWLPLLTSRHLVADHRRWLVTRCYLNPAGWVQLSEDPTDRHYLSRFRPGVVRAGFEVVDCPVMTSGGKNAADIRLVIDALDLLRADCTYDEFVIASGDSDFAPLLQRLRADDRRITVVSPGYSSAAYLSLADQMIGFDAIAALVRPEPTETDADAAAAGGEPAPEFQTFADFVTARYDDASAPLNLAALAQHAVRSFPGARDAGWFGMGTFSAAVARIGLENARLSQYFLWDAERHQPPAGTVAVDPDVPAAVATMVRTADLPRLGRETWPAVFAVLADYAAGHDFNLTEATRWPRDELARRGHSVGRPALSFVVRGTGFGGAPLDADPPPTADDIANAFLDNLLHRARLAGVELDDDAEGEVADWLGIAEPDDGADVEIAA